jgi:hypothetical protein
MKKVPGVFFLAGIIFNSFLYCHDTIASPAGAENYHQLLEQARGMLENEHVTVLGNLGYIYDAKEQYIGSTYLAMGKTSEAITFAELGLTFFEKNDMSTYSAGALNDLGLCYLINKDNKRAESSFVRSMEYSKPGRLNRFMMNSLEHLLIRLKSNQNRRLLAEQENQGLRADLEQRNKELTFNAMCIVKAAPGGEPGAAEANS